MVIRLRFCHVWCIPKCLPLSCLPSLSHAHSLTLSYCQLFLPPVDDQPFLFPVLFFLSFSFSVPSSPCDPWSVGHLATAVICNAMPVIPSFASSPVKMSPLCSLSPSVLLCRSVCMSMCLSVFQFYSSLTAFALFSCLTCCLLLVTRLRLRLPLPPSYLSPWLPRPTDQPSLLYLRTAKKPATKKCQPKPSQAHPINLPLQPHTHTHTHTLPAYPLWQFPTVNPTSLSLSFTTHSLSTLLLLYSTPTLPTLPPLHTHTHPHPHTPHSSRPTQPIRTHLAVTLLSRLSLVLITLTLAFSLSLSLSYTHHPLSPTRLPHPTLHHFSPSLALSLFFLSLTLLFLLNHTHPHTILSTPPRQHTYPSPISHLSGS
jgi:hypothetical protein